MNKEPITEKGYAKLKESIRVLKEVQLPKAVEDIKISAGYGDLTENAEYEAAIESQNFILTRIRELEKLISKLIIIDPSQTEHTKVKFGSTVKIVNIDTDEIFIYTLVGGYESDPSNGKISYLSPIAKSLLGKEEGDEVTVNISGITTYEIESVYFDGSFFDG